MGFVKKRCLLLLSICVTLGIIAIILIVDGLHFPIKPKSKYESTSDPRRLFGNEPQSSLAGGPNGTSSGTEGIYVVMVFPLIIQDVWKKLGYDANDAMRRERQKEYVDCLRTNLRQVRVTEMHLLTNQPEQLKKVLSEEYKVNLTKIVLVNSTVSPTYGDIFKYVSNALRGKLAFVLNADNFMGDGFDQIDVNWWKSAPDLMYALTRHGLPNRPADCYMGPAGYCDPTGGTYVGSHDGFLFYVRGPLPETFLSELNFASHVYGSENVVIWAFKEKMGYRVENPCKRLVIYHNHCTNVRASDSFRPRVNVNGRDGYAEFTS